MTPSTRRQLLDSTAGAAAMSLAGCTSMLEDLTGQSETGQGRGPSTVNGWPLVGHDSHNTGFNPDASPVTTNPDVAWRASFDVGDVQAGYALFPRPAVADGAMYLGGRELTAYDFRDGSVSWSQPVEKPAFGAAVDDERIYCQSWEEYGSAEVVAFERPSGEAVWRAGGSWEYVGPPNVGTGAVVLASRDALVALDTDGTERWSLTLRNSPGIVPTIAGENVYHLSEGRQLGKYPLAGGKQAIWTADHEWSVSGAPAVSDGSIFVGEYISWYPSEPDNDARIYSFGTDGTERWSTEIGATSASPAVADGTVYALTGVHREIVDRGNYVEMRRDGVVRAFDASDGTERWSLTYPEFGNWRVAPVVAGDVCYVALRDDVSDDQKLVAIQNGTERWSRSLSAPAHHLAAVGSTLLVSLVDGTVLALR